MISRKISSQFARTVKTFFVILLSFISVLSVQAQSTIESATEQAPGGQSTSIDDLPIKPFRMPALQDVGGSPFLTAEYCKGMIELGQGRTINNVPVKFNTFNNAMMVLKNGEELKLEFFELVSFSAMEGNKAGNQFVFKAGYPEIE